MANSCCKFCTQAVASCELASPWGALQTGTSNSPAAATAKFGNGRVPTTRDRKNQRQNPRKKSAMNVRRGALHPWYVLNCRITWSLQIVFRKFRRSRWQGTCGFVLGPISAAKTALNLALRVNLVLMTLPVPCYPKGLQRVTLALVQTPMHSVGMALDQQTGRIAGIPNEVVLS